MVSKIIYNKSNIKKRKNRKNKKMKIPLSFICPSTRQIMRNSYKIDSENMTEEQWSEYNNLEIKHTHVDYIESDIPLSRDTNLQELIDTFVQSYTKWYIPQKYICSKSKNVMTNPCKAKETNIVCDLKHTYGTYTWCKEKELKKEIKYWTKEHKLYNYYFKN